MKIGRFGDGSWHIRHDPAVLRESPTEGNIHQYPVGAHSKIFDPTGGWLGEDPSFSIHSPALLGHRQGSRLLTHNHLQLKVMKTRELSAEIAKCDFTAPKVEIGSPARWRIVFRVWSCLEVLMVWDSKQGIFEIQIYNDPNHGWLLGDLGPSPEFTWPDSTCQAICPTRYLAAHELMALKACEIRSFGALSWTRPVRVIMRGSAFLDWTPFWRCPIAMLGLPDIHLYNFIYPTCHGDPMPCTRLLAYICWIV